MTEVAWLRLARSQHGVLSRAQGRATGLTDHQLDSLISRGYLQPRGQGVLVLAGMPLQLRSVMWAAVLATRGVLVAASAAYLWQLTPEPPDVVQLAIPASRRVVAPTGSRVRRCDIPARELTARHGLPVTTRTRSALDLLAGSASITDATAFADRAISQGWLRVSDIERRLARPAAGNPLLRRVLRTVRSGAEAESERRLHQLLRRHRVDGWQANFEFRSAGSVLARIDVAFVEQRLAIEVDGFAYHSGQSRFQRDRTRQNHLVNHGWTVLRFTWDDITLRPDQVIATILTALRRAA